jgi:hypothetical protein
MICLIILSLLFHWLTHRSLQMIWVTHDNQYVWRHLWINFTRWSTFPTRRVYPWMKAYVLVAMSYSDHLQWSVYQSLKCQEWFVCQSVKCHTTPVFLCMTLKFTANACQYDKLSYAKLVIVTCICGKLLRFLWQRFPINKISSRRLLTDLEAVSFRRRFKGFCLRKPLNLTFKT